METIYRYLINDKVMQGGKMPLESNFKSTTNYIGSYEDWQSSLTELVCDKDFNMKLGAWLVKSYNAFTERPIDITSVTTVKEICQYCNNEPLNGECHEVCEYKSKVYFKEVDQSFYSKESMASAFNFVENAMRYNPTDNNTFKILHPNTMIFNLHDKECSFKLKDGLITYDGDLDESAKILFNKVCELFNKESDIQSQDDMWNEVKNIIITETSRTRLDICKSKFKITRK